MENNPNLFATHMADIGAAEASVLNGRVIEMRRDGRNVSALCVGEPDFDTPADVKAAGIAAIEANKTKYAPIAGIVELREAVCRKFKRDNHLDYDPAQVIVSTGGKQVIFNAFAATLNPDDEVIMAQPFWLGYPDIVRTCRATPVMIDTRAEEGFLITPANLAAAITDKTKWLIINNPGNPTGAVYQRQDLVALADVLRDHPGIRILSDDIYEHIVYDDIEFATMAEVAADLKDRVLTMNGCSKGYAMTGWRLGFAAGPTDLIARMVNVQSQVTLSPSTISQWAAIAALDIDADYFAGNLAILSRRRDLACSILNQTPGLTCSRPKGAFYIYIDCQDVLGKHTPEGKVLQGDRDFASYLLDHADVAVMPGAAYGKSPFIRVSYVVGDGELEAACLRIQAACAALRAV
jgi:aspartate aminotransferase